jgi:hydroxypyruvate isomerase
MIGNIDPSMFRLLSRVVTEMGAGGSDKAELFNSIKPYLKEDRRDKIDKAISIAKIAKLARVAFAEFSEGGL